MSRRSAFSLLTAIAKSAARAQRQTEMARRRAIREQERLVRARERQARRASSMRATAAKEDRDRHIQDMIEEAADLNAALVEKVQTLKAILVDALNEKKAFSFDELKKQEAFPPVTPPVDLTRELVPPSEQDFVPSLKPLRWFDIIIPGAQARYERLVRAEEEKYAAALKKYEDACAAQKNQLEAFEREYQTAKQDFEKTQRDHNAEIDRFEAAYLNGEGEAITVFNTMLLEQSEYPEHFPCNFKVAYSAPSKELVIEFELPSVEIIPKESDYRYVRARNSIENKLRKEPEVRELYQDVVAALALRSLHIIFKMNRSDQLLVVAFNGYVETTDRTVGRKVKPHLISVRVTRDRFAEIDLSHIDKAACLRNLGARLSPRPNEHLPVKPIIEFDMVDKRFVDGTDLLTGLESRPNLMELTPFEFENLVGNLFSKMGLDTRQTQTSRDGGVDVVAFDARPVLGGKVVIQAKRYRHTVGVAAVRDLFGTMMNEGANKGILVTTSGYGPDAFDFARDKPIELIDGGNLLYLLAEHSQTQARIIMPEDTV